MRKTTCTINKKIKAQRLASTLNNMVLKGIDAKATVDHASNVVVDCDGSLTEIIPDLLHAFDKGDAQMQSLTLGNGRGMVIVKRAA